MSLISVEMAISSPIHLIQTNAPDTYGAHPMYCVKSLVNNLNSITFSKLYTQRPLRPCFASKPKLFFSSLIPRPKTLSKPLWDFIASANRSNDHRLKWAPQCTSSGNLGRRCLSRTDTSDKNPHGRNMLMDRRNSFWGSGWRIRARDDDFEGGDEQEYEMEEDYDEDADNQKDYDVDYDVNAGEFNMVESESFVSTEGWDAEMVVDYKINEDEFHKISLLDCDFFIRKVPDPDGNVFDFREMYVTPPDTDIYSIPEVVGEMPKKYIRCRKTNYEFVHVTEPPVDYPRAPLYKTEMEVMKVFLMKHYKNRRADDWDFVLDLEEIYVIDSKTKSISRANVVVNVPRGKYRDRTNEVLIVRDKGTSFKIIPSDQREDPDTIIETMQWERTKEKMEDYLRGFRDYEISNWF